MRGPGPMNARSVRDVRWSAAAERDLEEILEYVGRHSLDAAAQVYVRLRERAAALRAFPKRGRVVPELAVHGIRLYRELVVAPWRIVYRIAGRDPVVLAVVDARRRLEDLLLERVVRRSG